MKLWPPKRMYTYMMQRYLPLLSMTLFICWFIVLMQMLWLYTDELVGKGLDFWVLTQLIFHAAIMVLPTAVPLGILLASLMTFGSMGERLELLAMKSAGVPLHRIMAPLFFVVLGISFTLFIYLNTAVMDAQVRFYQIVFSVREARPDLDIPEGVFYDGISGYNIFVTKKDPKTRSLKGIMIYDYGRYDAPRVIMADSGSLRMDETKRFLTLNLFEGESFEPLQGRTFIAKETTTSENVAGSYLKEHFSNKQIVINLNMNFEMIDDGGLRSQFVGKNLIQLTHYLRDTAVYALDSVGLINANNALESSVIDRYHRMSISPLDTTDFGRNSLSIVSEAANKQSFSLDSLNSNIPPREREGALQRAYDRLTQVAETAQFRNEVFEQQAYFYRTHAQEWHRKFTFPIACLLFFFIGAPLGAIIRKGGIGMPMVASVLFFVVYYMLDTFGYNLSYNGTWTPAFGMWFSTLMLLPFCIFLTYKATRDSASLNLEAITIRLKQLFSPIRMRELSYRELVLNPLSASDALKEVSRADKALGELLHNPFMQRILFSQENMLLLNEQYAKASAILDASVARLRDYDSKLFTAKLMDLPFLPHSFTRFIPRKKILFWLFIAFLPLSLPYMVYCLVHRRKQQRWLCQCQGVLKELVRIIEQEHPTQETNK